MFDFVQMSEAFKREKTFVALHLLPFLKKQKNAYFACILLTALAFLNSAGRMDPTNKSDTGQSRHI